MYWWLPPKSANPRVRSSMTLRKPFGPLFVLDVRLPPGTGGPQVEGVPLDEEICEFGSDGRFPAAVLLPLGIGLTGAEPLLDLLDRGRESDVADGSCHDFISNPMLPRTVGIWARRERPTPRTKNHRPFCNTLVRKEKADVIGDHPAVFFQGEVPSVEQVELDVLKIPLVGVRPCSGKIGSFLPQTISVGGWYLRKYACHSGYSDGFEP